MFYDRSNQQIQILIDLLNRTAKPNTGKRHDRPRSINRRQSKDSPGRPKDCPSRSHGPCSPLPSPPIDLGNTRASADSSAQFRDSPQGESCYGVWSQSFAIDSFRKPLNFSIGDRGVAGAVVGESAVWVQ
jgi:hypothetical protein